VLIADVIETDVPELMELMPHVIKTSVQMDDHEMRGVLQNVSDNLQWAIEQPDVCAHLKCVVDAHIVGVILVKKFWNLCSLFVHPAFQGTGVGRSLLSEAVRRCSNKGDHAYMRVNAAPNAVSFYRGMGFVPDESRQSKDSSVPMMRALQNEYQSE
jgi:GNAT superfamily N-acetyltransferase